MPTVRRALLVCCGGALLAGPVAGQTLPPAIPTCWAGQKTVKTVDIQKIADIFRTGEFKKREFETTAEYSKRTAVKVSEANQLIAQSGASGLIFGVRLSDDHLKYDADRSILKMGNFTGGVLQRNSSGNVIISSSEITTGNYEASNAFGARIPVSIKVGSQLEVTNVKSFMAQVNTKPLDVPLTREEARDSKQHIGIAFSAKLKSPYFSTGQSHLNPKMDFPYDYTMKTETIYTDLNCAAVYNASTGRIILPVAVNRL